MATYDPYIKRAAGDFIAADDWNDIQRLARKDVAEHDHTGGLKGPKLTGDAIAADATLTVKRVNADEIKLGDRLLSTRLSAVEDVASKALSTKGGAIEGDLTIGGDLTVKGTINGGISTGGSGGGATFAIATTTEGKSFKTATFSTIDLSTTITLTEASIITATANVSVSEAASAQFAFIAVLSATKTSVPFVPREPTQAELEKAAALSGSGSTTSGTTARDTTSSSKTGQLDPRSYYLLLSAAASRGDSGVGVGATIVSSAISTTLPVGFTQVTALPAGSYTIMLAMKGTASIANGSIFVVTQTADLTPFEKSRY
jgi:hypothetical protein